MVLRKGAVALVIALSVVSVYFFVLNFNISYAKVGDEVCADFDGKKGDKKSTDGTVSKSIEGSGLKDGVEQGKEIIKNLSKWTIDDVKVKPDGSVEVISKCGKEGTVGEVNFCFPLSAKKEACVSVSKEKNLDEAIQGIIKAEATKEGIRGTVDAKINKIAENIELLRFNPKLSKEYSALLSELGLDNKKFLDAVENNPDAVKEMLANIAAGDAEGAKIIAESIGLKIGVTTGQLKALGERSVRNLPTSVRKGISELGTSICEQTGACSETIKEAIRGFASPVPVIDTRTTNIIGRDISRASRAKVVQQVYTELERKGFVPADLLHPETKRFEAAWRTTTEVLRNSLYAEQALHPELDQASVLALTRREQGIPGKVSQSSTGVRGQMQMTMSTARSTLGNILFTANGGQRLDTATFAREDPIGSVLSGSIHLNQLLHKYAPVQNDGSYNKGGVATAFQAYNGFGGIGGDRSFGAKAAYDTEIFRQVLQTGNTAALARLYPDRSRSSSALNLFSRILTTQPSDASTLPSPTYDPNPTLRSASPVISSLGKSPFGLSSGGLGDLLNKFTGGGKKSGGGQPSSGKSAQHPAPRSTSVSQPLPPAKPPTSATPDKQTEQTSEPIRPTLSLIAYPSTAQKGDSLNIIWSAVGVSDTQKCRLNVESSEAIGTLAEGNEGTEVIQVPVTTQLTELRFTLLCVPRDTRISPEDARTSITIRLK